jgi:glycosyltransferase involved in cell wall biosynthesis
LHDEQMMHVRPNIVVFTQVFPNTAQRHLGLFVRERMFRVARALPLSVVAPVPWFPFQRALRRFRRGYRPDVPAVEIQDGIVVYHPIYLSIPRFCKSLDPFFMVLCTLPLLRRLKRSQGAIVIDSHFVYPDGVAAGLAARWLKVPYTITLRGQIARIEHTLLTRRLAVWAMRNATRVFSVSDSLRRGAVRMGVDGAHMKVIANGVDLDKFFPVDRAQARARLGLPQRARILVSVGGLTERKGFHRVIEQLHKLLQVHPDLLYVVVGGTNTEGDWEARLRSQVHALGLESVVHFLGALPPEELRYAYSSADLFVLATRMEGWANVFLEAMACGLPVVTTRVGGNEEVVSSPELGILVPFGDGPALAQAIEDALHARWDAELITAYARANSWESRIPQLVSELTGVAAQWPARPIGVEERGESMRS